MANSPVLVVGGTGRCGLSVIQHLLSNGVPVRTIVRSPHKLPDDISVHPNFTVTKASLLDMSDEELTEQVQGCRAVVSCLGHVLNFNGVFGHPRLLCKDAAQKLCEAIERTNSPGKFVLLNTVGVSNPKGDRPRSFLEKRFIGALSVLIPPMKDNIKAAHYLSKDIGTENKLVKWVSVRPDTLIEGEETKYSVHSKLRTSIFNAEKTQISNVGHFICELATNYETWTKWEGQMPVIVNEA